MNRKIVGAAVACALLSISASAQAQFGFLRGLGGGADAQKMAAQADQFAEKQPEKLKPFFRALYLEGERNAVFNFNHLGLAAFELGEWDIAKKAFDQAIVRIDSIYADDPNAQKAKSVWNEEKVKDWKGEPYERAMTYYYRGLLYLRDGEYDNAAASFRAADYQDTQAEAETYQGDFGLMLYLAAWSQNCRGNDSTAKDLFALAASRDPSVASLSYQVKFLAVVDAGVGPVKYGEGKHKEILKFRAPPNGKDAQVSVLNDTAPLAESRVAGDVQFQAETRGGRPVDGILNGKAQWKTGTQTAGEVSTTVGVAAMQAGLITGDRNMANMGALGSVAGLFAQVAAAQMTPAADTRAWTSLPSTIHVVPAAELPANAKLGLRFEGDAGAPKPMTLVATQGACSIAWARTRSALGPADGGAASISASPKAEDAGREEKNAAFRSALSQTF